MAHGKLVEQANKRLNTRRQTYIDALSYFEAEEGVFIVQLDASARWIEDGMPAYNMLESLLSSPKAKVSKKTGKRYLVVPFDKSPGLGSTGATPAQADLISTIKSEMKSKGLSFGKIEKNQDGSDKMGLLHSFNIMDKPLKTGEGVGQGHGPIGAPKQGKSGIPFLQGIKVYQKTAQDKQGNNFTKKSIMTFRIAVEGAGGWENPGVPPTNLFPEMMTWIESQWSETIVPQLIANIRASF